MPERVTIYHDWHQAGDYGPPGRWHLEASTGFGRVSGRRGGVAWVKYRGDKRYTRLVLRPRLTVTETRTAVESALSVTRGPNHA